MKAIAINTIKNNNVSNQEVYYDKNFLLFFPGTCFSEELRNILIEVDIQIVFSDGVFVDIDQFLDTDKCSIDTSYPMVENSGIAQIKYIEFYNKLEKIFELVASQQRFVYAQLNSLVYEDILPSIRNNLYSYLAITEFRHLQEKNLNPYLCLMLNNLLFVLTSLESDISKSFLSINKRIQMGIAALLLDIGILPIIYQLTVNKKPSKINIREKKIIPIIAKIEKNIFKLSFVPYSITSMIEPVHQLLINSKTPIAIAAQDAAKYIFVASSYVYLLTNVPHNDTCSPFEGITFLLKNVPTIFSPKFVKSLTYTLGYTPPGSYVQLQNNSYGMVIASQIVDLKSPLVHIILDPAGNLKPKPTVISTTSGEFKLKNLLSMEESITLQKQRIKILKKTQFEK